MTYKLCIWQLRLHVSAAASASLRLAVTQKSVQSVLVLHVSSRLSSSQLCSTTGLHLSSAAVTVLRIKRAGIAVGLQLSICARRSSKSLKCTVTVRTLQNPRPFFLLHVAVLNAGIAARAVDVQVSLKWKHSAGSPSRRSSLPWRTIHSSSVYLDAWCAPGMFMAHC